MASSIASRRRVGSTVASPSARRRAAPRHKRLAAGDGSIQSPRPRRGRGKPFAARCTSRRSCNDSTSNRRSPAGSATGFAGRTKDRFDVANRYPVMATGSTREKGLPGGCRPAATGKPVAAYLKRERADSGLLCVIRFPGHVQPGFMSSHALPLDSCSAFSLACASSRRLCNSSRAATLGSRLLAIASCGQPAHPARDSRYPASNAACECSHLFRSSFPLW